MAQSTARIAWLSDIHLRELYTKDDGKIGKDRASNLFAELVNEITSHELDYILIGGDIAFAGSSAEYLLFEELFLRPLHAKYGSTRKPPKIITIPGNHDISWKVDEHLREYLITFTKDDNSFGSRKEFIANPKKNDLFFKSFLDYSTYFSNTTSQMQKDFFQFPNTDDPINPCLVHTEYDKRRLFGYLVDYEKAVIFVMLNTAWFAIGDNINKLLVTEDPKSIVADIKTTAQTSTRANFEKVLITLLDVKSKIVEFGNQVANAEGFPIDDLKNRILENPKFTVVTLMHHPPSWLSWNELYSYDLDHPTGLLSILNLTDILLTGHEHVPISKEAENDKLGFHHLKAGMLMEDDITKKEWFEHSRFSILEIVNARNECFYKENKFLYNKSGSKSPWQSKGIIHKEVINNREHRLSDERRKSVIDNFSSFNTVKFLDRKLGRTLEPVTIDSLPEHTCLTNCKIEFFKDGNDIRTTFLVKQGLNFFGLPSGKNCHTELATCIVNVLKRIGEQFPNTEVKIHFIFLDLMIPDEENQFKYPSIRKEDLSKIKNKHLLLPNDTSTEEVYSDIVRYAEQIFNNFRNIYFSFFEHQASLLLEEKAVSETASGFLKEFQSVAGIKFILDVISYWDFERFCKRH